MHEIIRHCHEPDIVADDLEISTAGSEPSSVSFIHYWKIIFGVGIRALFSRSFLFCGLDTCKMCPTDAESPASAAGSFR